MAEGAAEGEFRVTDRRRRVEEAEPTPAPQREEHAAPRAAEQSAEGAPHGGETAWQDRQGEPTRPVERGERTLEGLFLMLASSAVVALGQTPDPATGQVRDRDPAAASGAIDLLTLLRDKTEGHRSPNESRLLDELIYDLQLRYVAATKPRL